MGARSGNNYLSTVKKLGAQVWFEGVPVPNVTSHEVLGSRARSIASLYDLQMEKPEAMTFRTSDGGRAGMSFIQPRTVEEVRKRGRMMKIWADYNCGTWTESPERANLAVAAMSAASALFAESDSRHGENIENYYREACSRDWCICIALQGVKDFNYRLGVREQTPDGPILEGQCATGPLGSVCEELLVLPVDKFHRETSVPSFPWAFAVPSNARGLKFLAQRSWSRLGQPGCIVVFDKVLLPWNRVFLHDDVRRADVLLTATSADTQLDHQNAIRTLANAEFMVGLAALLVEGLGTNSDAIGAALSEMVTLAEKMQAEIRGAEEKAVATQWRTLAPAPGAFVQGAIHSSRLQSRLAEIVRLASPSSATSISWTDAGVNLEIALELARNAASGASDTAAYPVSLKPIVERAREFIARPR